jgi:ABC-type transport system involved in multi-copper enzyme maturation permease subunit
MSQRSNNIDKLKLLRTFAMGVMAAGAILSVYLAFQSFYSNQSIFLLLLSALWVLSPFAALLGLDKLAMQWSLKARIICCLLMVIITVFSLLTYTRSFGFPGIRNPVMLWATPLFSLMIICMGYFFLKSTKSADM